MAALSLTGTVKLNVPAAVGTPAIVPEEPLSARPGGTDPLESDQEYGGVPPDAANVRLYELVIVAGGRGADVVIFNCGATVIDKELVAVTCEESLTCTLKLNVPE